MPNVKNITWHLAVWNELKRQQSIRKSFIRVVRWVHLPGIVFWRNLQFDAVRTQYTPCTARYEFRGRPFNEYFARRIFRQAFVILKVQEGHICTKFSMHANSERPKIIDLNGGNFSPIAIRKQHPASCHMACFGTGDSFRSVSANLLPVRWGVLSVQLLAETFGTKHGQPTTELRQPSLANGMRRWAVLKSIQIAVVCSFNARFHLHKMFGRLTFLLHFGYLRTDSVETKISFTPDAYAFLSVVSGNGETLTLSAARSPIKQSVKTSSFLYDTQPMRVHDH